MSEEDEILLELKKMGIINWIENGQTIIDIPCTNIINLNKESDGYDGFDRAAGS